MGKRKYKVVGEDDVFGYEPGDVFEIEYRDGVIVRPGGFEHSESALLKSGALEKVSRRKDKQDAESTRSTD